MRSKRWLTEMGHAELLRKFLGKPVRDIYGRNLGNVVGIILDEQGGVGAIGIERGDGGFSKYFAENILIKGEELVLVPSWKVNAESFQRGITHTEKRIDALDQLFSSGRISEQTYKNMKNSYEGMVGQRNNARENLLSQLKNRSTDLVNESNVLEEFLANIEVQHLTGELDEESYSLAIDSLKMAYNRMIAEKNDIDSVLDEVTRIKQDKYPQDEPSAPSFDVNPDQVTEPESFVMTE